MPRHKNQPNQRPRYSTSDSDSDYYRPTPKRMNTKSYSYSCPKPINLTMSTTSDTTSTQSDQTVSTADLYKLMLTVKQNQDSLRTSLEQRISNLETKFTNEIKMSMKTLKDEMTLEFAQVDNKIKELETKMSNYESKQQEINNDLPSVSMKNVQPKLVFKNIKSEGLNTDSLETYVNGILRSIGLEFSVVSAQQIGNPNNGRVNNTQRPKPVLVTFADENQRVDVLKNKRKLKDINDYKNIYIETDRTRQERINDANMRQIIKSIPELQFRGGRVTVKQN